MVSCNSDLALNGRVTCFQACRCSDVQGCIRAIGGFHKFLTGSHANSCTAGDTSSLLMYRKFAPLTSMSLLCNSILNLITLNNLISATEKIIVFQLICLLGYVIPAFPPTMPSLPSLQRFYEISNLIRGALKNLCGIKDHQVDAQRTS